MATAAKTVEQTCREAKDASHQLARASRDEKDGFLRDLADRIDGGADGLLEANRADLDAGREEGLNEALLDRLALTEARIAEMAKGVREIADLDDPVGEVVEGWTLANGLDVAKKRVPIGVVAVVYEARPNVTIDAAALCLKSGNAAVLRGSSSAESSNGFLAGLIAEALASAELPGASVSLLSGGGHEQLEELATQEGLVDLIIPRGGEGLKNALKAVAKVPVMYAAAGNCHVYVHQDADLEMAERVAYNAKVQRPGVCNAAETLLVHRDVAAELLPRLLAKLSEAGVELVGDERTKESAESAPIEDATEADWDTEYHGLKMAVGVVDSLGEAIDHINRHGTGHSEAIITRSQEVGDEFTDAVDSAAVYVNASTRFTDGYEFGMGAEIGNSTQKLHARGPIGLRELTTTKYVVHGNGQIRE
ncbi:MAG: glutamate-5-semialdehyde dehydrogenase [Solirubrobacterales bacterium]|jgi:glutamate-5-semialdehyde dehydrogenase|nr:glutamate-5-semialdehyde dehydrogenase [Solirubrobacterales bacterium]